MSRRVLSAVMVAALSTSAYAEDIVAYQAEGDAPASGTDSRTMALDAAFAKAVTAALADLVAPEIRVSRKGDIDKEIVGRARLWVAKFSVTKDETLENRRELSVSVRVDRDKLRARLAELGIATKEVAAQPGGDEPVTSVPAKTVTVLLRVASPQGAATSYGSGAVAELPGVGALTNLLRTHGYAVRKAPASGPADELGDDAADALAAEAKAESYALANVTVGNPVNVRGRPGTAALVTANVKLVERAGRRLVGRGTGTAAALGDESAVSRALAFAIADVIPPAPAKLGAASAFAGDDTPIEEPGIVLVRLPVRTPLSLVLLEQKYLAGAKGVRAATLRRLSPGGWVIGVSTSESIEQVARIAKKAPASDTRASVKIVGDIVEVALQGGS